MGDVMDVALSALYSYIQSMIWSDMLIWAYLLIHLLIRTMLQVSVTLPTAASPLLSQVSEDVIKIFWCVVFFVLLSPLHLCDVPLTPMIDQVPDFFCLINTLPCTMCINSLPPIWSCSPEISCFCWWGKKPVKSSGEFRILLYCSKEGTAWLCEEWEFSFASVRTNK